MAMVVWKACCPGRCVSRAGGWSLVELLLVLALVGMAAGVAAGAVSGGVAWARERGAVRLVATRVRMVRVEAMQRGSAVALRFVRRGDEVRLQMVVDGDGDGVRSADVAAGVDQVFGVEETIEQSFPGVRFGIVVSGPGIEAGEEAVEAGGDPLRLGSGTMVSFGADGAGSSGTVYLCSARGRQFAVRVYGVTGRVRVFAYQVLLGRWVEG